MERYCFGVDIGGTGVKVGLFNETGNLTDKWTFDTRRTEDGKDVLKDVAEFIKLKMDEMKLDKDQILGIGVGLPGPVREDGYVREFANLGMADFNIVDELSELTGLTVKAGNDANIAALGEQWKGSGKGFQSMVMVTLGTGVGGGVIINGKILAGSAGAGGEIGHMLVNPKEERHCGCGKCGCLEQYASATGIVRIAKEMAAKYEKDSALTRADNITAKLVFDLAKENDELALAVVDEACRYLGMALANVAQVVDPEAFVIGGGVSQAGEILIEHVIKHYVPYVMESLKDRKFILASLGNDAGIYGAARLILS